MDKAQARGETCRKRFRSWREMRASGTGSGSHTIGPAGDGAALTLRQTTTGCVNVGARRTHGDVITLTPVPR